MACAAPFAAVAVLSACSPSPEAEPSERATSRPIEAAPLSVSSSDAVDSAPPPILLPVPTVFRALGTEPFWSAEVDGKRLTYSTPVTQEGAVIAVARKEAGKGVVYTGSIGGKPLEMEIWRETCSDGMSDTDYPFAVIRRIGPETQRGCAR